MSCLPTSKRGRRRKSDRRNKSNQSDSPVKKRRWQNTVNNEHRSHSSPADNVVQNCCIQGGMVAEGAENIIARDKLWLTDGRGASLLPQQSQGDDNNMVAQSVLTDADFAASSNVSHASNQNVKQKSDKILCEADGDDSLTAQCVLTDEDLGLGFDFQNKVAQVTDPISLEPIDVHHFFLFRQLHKYNISSLTSYLLASHDFRDPITRQQFTSEELSEIDRLQSSCPACAGQQSILEAHRKWDHDSQKQADEFANAVCGVEHLIDGVIASARDIVSGEYCAGLPHNRFARSSMILVSIFPELDHLIQQLHGLAPARVKICLDSYQVSLKGHPKRPNKDPFGLLDFCLAHLQQLEKQWISA